MNNERRKEIAAILEKVTELRGKVEDLQNAEQEAFDNMPEGLQQSERGQACENAASRLDDAMTAFDEIESALEEAKE